MLMLFLLLKMNIFVSLNSSINPLLYLQISCIRKSAHSLHTPSLRPPTINDLLHHNQFFQSIHLLHFTLYQCCDVSGIIHFAGTTHGDAELLCNAPLLHPLFLPAVTPLYLSIVTSLQKSCPAARPLFKTCNVTESVQILSGAMASTGMTVRYSPGPGGFSWPPR